MRSDTNRRVFSLTHEFEICADRYWCGSRSARDTSAHCQKRGHLHPTKKNHLFNLNVGGLIKFHSRPTLKRKKKSNHESLVHLLERKIFVRMWGGGHQKNLAITIEQKVLVRVSVLRKCDCVNRNVNRNKANSDFFISMFFNCWKSYSVVWI